MKKLYILLGCALLSIMLPCCKKAIMGNGHGEYKVSILSEANTGVSAANLEDARQSFLFTGRFTREGAEKEITISFRGTEYAGVYEYSQQGKGTTLIRDSYAVDDPVCRHFAVESETKVLLYIDVAGYGTVVQEAELPLPVLSEEEILEKAADYASDWISTEEYGTPEITIRDGSESMASLYQVLFVSKAQGIETTDRISVLLSDRGVLHQVSASEPGWTKKYRDALRSFSVEEAIRAGMAASGLTSPTVTSKRFGISREGKVFLMLGLSGTGSEAPVLLAISEE